MRNHPKYTMSRKTPAFNPTLKNKNDNTCTREPPPNQRKNEIVAMLRGAHQLKDTNSGGALVCCLERTKNEHPNLWGGDALTDGLTSDTSTRRDGRYWRAEKTNRSLLPAAQLSLAEAPGAREQRLERGRLAVRRQTNSWSRNTSWNSRRAWRASGKHSGKKIRARAAQLTGRRAC
jgi:hypothetical protein